MVFLILQVVFASSFTLLIKWTQNRGTENVVNVGAINYIVAAVAISPFFFVYTPSPVSPGAMWTGGSMGAVYFIAYFFAIFAIKTVGASTASVVSVLSILMPIVFAAFQWGERPNPAQMLGIGLAILSLTLIGSQTNRPSKDTPSNKWISPIVLVCFFILCGFSRIAQETFKFVSQPDQFFTFTLTAFSVASIPSTFVLITRRKSLKKMEFVFGIAMGLSNVLQTLFILKAFEYFPGFIVFPVTSAGAVLFTTCLATGVMGERLSRRTCIGIAISVVALCLLKWLSF